MTTPLAAYLSVTVLFIYELLCCAKCNDIFFLSQVIIILNQFTFTTSFKCPDRQMHLKPESIDMS